MRRCAASAASAPPTDKIFSVYRRDAQLPPISSTYMVIVKKVFCNVESSYGGVDIMASSTLS